MAYPAGNDHKRRKLVPEMEGRTARWYARVRAGGDQMRVYRTQAVRLTEGLSDGADVLEVAPGPGYLAIEMAKLNKFRVTGLDISRTFVEIATGHARRAGVTVDFRHGDVARLPFDAESFDLVVCQAAFKNFSQPVTALDEMHRVLRAGGTAVIDDMCRDVTAREIRAEVAGMGLTPLNRFVTRRTLSMLRRRAYSPRQFERLVADSAFRTCQTRADGLSLRVRLTR